MNLHPTIQLASRKDGLATPKFQVRVCAFHHDVSKVKAIDAFAKLTGMTLTQAKWFLNQMPQDLAIPCSEYFQGVVMDEFEAREVSQILMPYFDLSWREAGGHVLGYGMVVVPPWAVKDGEPTQPANAE